MRGKGGILRGEEMRDEEPIWFSRRDVDLPDPDELTPLSQTLITPDLALVFGIAATPNSISNYYSQNHNLPLPPFRFQSNPEFHPQMEYYYSDLGGSGGGGDYQRRTSKRPRLSWTIELHKKFIDAISQIGINNAVPKTIMQRMNVEGLTREKVASHLQKYRLYLRSKQELSSGSGGSEPVSAADSAMNHLFASTPVPHNFLNHRQLPSVEPPTQPFVTSQTVAAAQRQQYCHHSHIQRHGSRPNMGFDPGFWTTHPQLGLQGLTSSESGSRIEEMETGVSGGGRRILALFPTKDD